ncbi:MAG: glycosyltransferase family 4 protein [Candidatus Latescibacterota bacterium]|nr:MAG: glycosyltransferase family 4 protein [Candidatus Latescibacterota bacterium]
MKICIVSPTLPLYFRHDETARVGGSEVQAAFLVRALSSAGHEVTAVVADLRPDDALPCPAHNSHRSRDGVPGLRFFHPRLTGVYRALGRADADVYYQRNASMLTGVTALYCRRKGKLFVYGAGSDTDFWFRAARMDNFRDRCLFYMGLKLAHGVVVQNQFQKRRYLEKHRGPVRVIANGIDVTDPENTRTPDLIVWTGGIRRIKQPEIFLELARRIPEQQFALVGGGAGVEPAFERQIAQETTKIPNLTHTGHLPHTRVAEHLTRALVLVNTSRVEGFPNAYLEAWNCGVPVVTFNDVDGIIENEDLGVICRDINHMTETVRSIVSDPERRNAMGGRGRKIVAERFSPGVLAREYVEFFEELLKKNRESS